MGFAINVIVLCVWFLVVDSNKKISPFSDDFINRINRINTTWTAGKNFDVNTDLDQVKYLFGVHPDNKLFKPPLLYHQIPKSIPESFDAREKWANCPSLHHVRDQSTCGSCWAFASVEAITDRICIHSEGKVTKIISAEDLLTCCDVCGFGCDGGFPFVAWQYWVETGISTGGDYNTTDGCRSYYFPECEHHTTGPKPPCDPDSKPTPPCVKACDNGVKETYQESLSFGKIAYGIDSDVLQIQTEILQNGPVGASLTVYEDFLSYKSGVYQHVYGDVAGGHAIKIVGWGVENGVEYWLVANSWNPDWGEAGFFKIIRGVNECGIEEEIVAGLPKY